MTYKIVSIPQHFSESKKTLQAGTIVEQTINQMAAQGYEYVGVVLSTSYIHSGCCCCKTVIQRYDNHLVFKK